MEQDSYSDVVYENYFELHTERPPWSTHNPPKASASVSTSRRSKYYHINFTFSCESHFTEWVESEDSPLPHLSSQHSQPEADTYIVLNRDEFFDNRLCRKIMARELRELPLTNSLCQDLILAAMEQAGKAVLTMPSHHNVLNLHLRVHIVYKCTIRRVSDSIMSRIMQESFDVAPSKVPAAEAAVEMVMREKVELNETEMCTICLEEVREAVRMPCKHVFHGDCIGEWLRMDHCCPLCRFQIN